MSLQKQRLLDSLVTLLALNEGYSLARAIKCSLSLYDSARICHDIFPVGLVVAVVLSDVHETFVESLLSLQFLPVTNLSFVWSGWRADVSVRSHRGSLALQSSDGCL